MVVHVAFHNYEGLQKEQPACQDSNSSQAALVMTPKKSAKMIGHTEIRTRVTGFKVLCASHYTIRPGLAMEAKACYINLGYLERAGSDVLIGGAFFLVESMEQHGDLLTR
jgi:hypothetical protein